MSQRDDSVPLRHMLEHARESCALVSGRVRDELRSNRMLQLALTRLVEIVGEAAGRVSPETHARFPNVPWREAIATRHRITHGYDVVDYDILWDTVLDDFPPLVAALEQVLTDLD
jgi:uncharacterized protein with HEPN domain